MVKATFDYIDRVSGHPFSCDREVFEMVIQMTRVISVNQQLAQLLEERRSGTLSESEYDRRKSELKRQLPVFCFHARFPTGVRRCEDAMPSGLVIYDADHVGDARKYWNRAERRLRKAGVLAYVALAHVTPSGEGLRLVFVCPLGMSIPQAQAWMAGVLGDKVYDTSVSDLARCSFAVPRDYFLRYEPSVLFAPHPPESAPFLGTPPDLPAPASSLRPVATSVQPSLFDGKGARKAGGKKAEGRKAGGRKGGEAPGFKGIAYADIISAWLAANGGEPVEGERNDRLYRLAYDLATITDANADLLFSIMPSYGLPSGEMQRLIASACKHPYHARSRVLEGILHRLAPQPSAGEEQKGSPPRQGMSETAWLYGSTPPPMPRQLPEAVRHLVSSTPALYRAAVAQAIFPALATHLYDTHFRYLDNTLHEATLMNVLMAPSGSGKSSVNKPIEMIMADIKARDEVNLLREQQWKDALALQRPSEKPLPRPGGLVVQMIDPDITSAKLVSCTRDAGGRFLYLRANEVEQLDTLAVGLSGPQQFKLICLAYDADNEFGQMRVSQDAVSAKVKIRLNMNLSTTIGKGIEYFRRVVNDGPLSRVSLCTIPEVEIGSDIPVFGDYGEEFASQLRPYIDNLNAATGELGCRNLSALARQMLRQMQLAAVLTQDRVLDNLAHRAVQIAWLKACVLYVANGCVWERAIGTFAQWSLRYDLWCKLHFFGAEMRAAMDIRPREDYPKVCANQLDMLPDTFTMADVAALPVNKDSSDKKLADMVRHWVYRKKVKRLDGGLGYEKKN